MEPAATMTNHPAARARTFTGIASAAALVAMVAGFELSAQATELSAATAGANAKTRTLSPVIPNSGATAPAQAPAAAPVVAAPAPAPVIAAPAPAPATPPVATTTPSTKP